MADFSELCPLFETGVFHELTFPNIGMTDVSACANALLFSYDCMASTCSDFDFGRTIVVTDAWLRPQGAIVKGIEYLHLKHYSSLRATPTTFATLEVRQTATVFDTHSWCRFSSITETTFTSAAVLGLAPATVTAASGGVFDLMIRYKEK